MPLICHGIADSTSSFTVSIGFGFQQLFHYLHILPPESDLLPFWLCLPFWYLFLMLSSRRPLPASSPLRTVRATFTASRSNISKPFLYRAKVFILENYLCISSLQPINTLNVCKYLAFQRN